MEWVRIEQHFHSYPANTFGKSLSTKWEIFVVEGDLKNFHVVGEQSKMWDQLSEGPIDFLVLVYHYLYGGSIIKKISGAKF